MSLTTLQWRKLPVRTLGVGAEQSVTTVLNTIYDMMTGSLYFDGSTRTTGSNSAWKNVGKFTTGSNTEAVYFYPPTQTALSQSVIIAGKNVSGSVTSTVPPVVTDETAIATGMISIACVKNAGAFSSWATASNGFGAGSVSTGYATIANSGSILATNNNKIVIYESQEAIAIFFTRVGTAITWAGIAGAFVDPEQTSTSVDAEADNRLYGVAVGNHAANTGIDIGFWGIGTSFLSHGSPTNTNRMVFFTPQSANIFTASTVKPTNSVTSAYVTTSGKFVKSSMIVVAGATYSTPTNFVGRLREINMVKQMTHNTIVRDASNNIIGFVGAASETTAGDSAFFNY
jgi:hypothetical protein